jgi:hypothetical protein
MQPDDMLIQRAALALAHLMTASDDEEMNSLDRETIRRCAAAAAGENFRRLVVDCAQSWATTIEDGIERMTERHEIELALRSVRRLIVAAGLGACFPA